MKIALCYSGRPSGPSWAFSNHLLALMASEDTEVDVFSHFWKPSRGPGAGYPQLWPIMSKEDRELIRRRIPTDNPDAVIKLKNLTYHLDKNEQFLKEIIHGIDTNTIPLPVKRYRAHEIETKQKKCSRKKVRECWVCNAMSMFYSIGKSINLALEVERKENFKYDFIFRLRTDMIFIGYDERALNKCDGSKLNIAPTHWDDIAAPKRWNEFRGDERETGCPDAMDDIFAFGNGEVMRKYGEVYSNYSNLASKLPTCQECLLGMHIKESNLEVVKQKWPLALIAPNNNAEGFLPEESVCDYGFNPRNVLNLR